MISGKPSRVVLYGRVSTVTDQTARGRRRPQTDARSVDDQLAELRRWAEREQLDIVAELRDDGYSASQYARPTKVREDWLRAMELISTGQVDILAVWEFSRATRDRTVYAALLAACTNSGCKISINGSVHDPNDPDDSFMLDLSASLAVRESAVTSQRTKRAAASRAAEGEPHGRVPDGYKIIYDPETRKAIKRIVDPERAPIIREIVERILNRESAFSIATDLNDRGITTRSGKKWLGGNLIRRVQSPTLAGLRVYRGEVVDGVTAKWPAIITIEEHYRLRALLSEPARKTNREGNRVKHLGTGIYRCGECGTAMRIISGYRPNGTRRVRYTCPGAYCVQRAADLTDETVSDAVIAYLSQPDVITELIDPDEDADARRAATEAAEWRARIADAREKASKLIITMEDFAAFRREWEPKLRDAERRARPKNLPEAVFEIAGPDAAELWTAAPIHVKRAIVKELFTVKIHRSTKKGTNQFTPFDAESIEITRKARA